jgi:hypothetical protein
MNALAIKYDVAQVTSEVGFPTYDNLDDAPYMVHGDVQLHAVNKVPEQATYKGSNEILRGNGGHAHAFVQDEATPTAFLFLLKNEEGVEEQYVVVLKDTALDNPGRHDACVVPKGLYKVHRTREVDHVREVLRTVID